MLAWTNHTLLTLVGELGTSFFKDTLSLFWVLAFVLLFLHSSQALLGFPSFLLFQHIILIAAEMKLP